MGVGGNGEWDCGRNGDRGVVWLMGVEGMDSQRGFAGTRIQDGGECALRCCAMDCGVYEGLVPRSWLRVGSRPNARSGDSLISFGKGWCILDESCRF